MMKKILALVLALLTLLSCVSCIGGKVYEAADAEFSANGITLTLTKAFKEVDAATYGYTAAFDSAAVAVFALKESFSLVNSLGATSKTAYAELLRSANAARNPGELKTEDGIVFFEYNFHNTDENVTYSYFTTVHEGKDAYWMVQFATKQADYDEYRPYLLKWAKTVNVNG